MQYVYFLKTKDGKVYVGCTNNLEQRLGMHKSGKALFTKSRLPLKLIYCEAYASTEDAYRREASLKRHGQAWRRIRERISQSLLC